MKPMKHESSAIQNGGIISQPECHKKTTRSLLIDVFESDPTYTFTILDLEQRTGLSKDAVKSGLKRILNDTKKPCPIKKIDQGLYSYERFNEAKFLTELGHIDHWKVENLVFYFYDTPEARASACHERSTLDTTDEDFKRQSISKKGYPLYLSTGQKVDWGIYKNGTEVVSFSANGNKPFSPDLVLTLLQQIKRQGLDFKKAVCSSFEVNIDSRTRKIEGVSCVTMEVFRNTFLKIYNHDDKFMRTEVRTTGLIPAPDILSMIRSMTDSMAGQDALKEVAELKSEIRELKELFKEGMMPFIKKEAVKIATKHQGYLNRVRP